MEASDLELARIAAGGDESAFHTLIDRHARVLFRVAMSMSRNRDDAEDLMQETMIGAYRGLKNFAGRSSVKTWLVQIMTRQAAKAWHKGRDRRNTLSLYGPEGQTDHESDAAMSTRDPAVGVDEKIDVSAVMQSMSESHREILVLREIHQLSYEEMTQVLGVPIGTVESRLSRARGEFREKYERLQRRGQKED